MRSFPVMLIAVLLYNLVAFGGGLFGHPPDHVANALHDCGMLSDTDSLLSSGFGMTLFSGARWTFHLGDLLVLVSLALLFVEIIKATRVTAMEVMNHSLSTLVFAAALIEFVVLRQFATSTFFFIVLMCLFDVIAGFTISSVAAKREISVAPPVS
ncbi:MAG TPA: hypothetical protein VK779_06020 [Rhizomicrobium sp.]|jgi:hypothetical protein|nr:hypothetical protein [Rhizomicrobium sp.]